MDKVKISKEQAELLDDLLTRNNVEWILKQLAEWIGVIKTTKEMTDLHHWYIKDPLTVSKAMIVGYEVEKTPEDKVMEYYTKLNKDAIERDLEKYSVNHIRHEMQGVINTLMLLNIKIAGVNHE